MPDCQCLASAVRAPYREVMDASALPLVLVTGATGYVGGRLVPRLIDAGFRVRVLVRDALKLTDVPWASDVEIVTGDLDDASTLPAATDGVEVLYYLVHSMGRPGHFREQE